MIQDPHAESKKLYEQDALETDKPWKRWEFCVIPPRGIWYECYDRYMNGWDTQYEYRRIAQTLTINGHEVPVPLYAKPEGGVKIVYFPTVTNEALYHWSYVAAIRLSEWKRGIYHLTAEAAVLHAKAVLSFTERKKP